MQTAMDEVGTMNTLIFLILFPLAVSFLALVPPLSFAVRKTVGVCINIILCAVPIYLLVANLDRGPAYFHLENSLIDVGMLLVELFIAVYIVYLSARAKRYLPILLVVVQSLIMVVFEFTSGHGMQIEHSLFVDKFSIVMALIVGIIGSAICLYAIGYIPEYHEHYREVKARPRFFFFLMYLFLSAMFGIIFANNLMWLYFFWEITTVCSFLLIGYKDDAASRESAFRALNMNLVGGVVFAVGLVCLYSSTGIMELDKLLQADKGVVLLPAVCLAFAGLVKSAQFPFSSWLTGAMVAPTPVSALLHSSTMVKAGVYLILRVAPVMEHTAAAKMLTLIGGVSFLITALIAISQSNAKKVLAYSTISNLGLIVACMLFLALATWHKLTLIDRKQYLYDKVKAGLEAVEANDSLVSELTGQYELLRPVFAAQQNTLDTLTTYSLLQRARTNRSFWYVVLADQQSYFSGPPVPVSTNKPVKTNLTATLPDARPPAAATITNLVPAKPGCIAELCVPEDADTARTVLSQLVNELKQQPLFSKVDLLSDDLRRGLADHGHCSLRHNSYQLLVFGSAFHAAHQARKLSGIQIRIYLGSLYRCIPRAAGHMETVNRELHPFDCPRVACRQIINEIEIRKLVEAAHDRERFDRPAEARGRRTRVPSAGKRRGWRGDASRTQHEPEIETEETQNCHRQRGGQYSSIPAIRS